MTVRELFEGVLQNKVPTMDMATAIDQFTNKGKGISKGALSILSLDFSQFLQEYVDDAVSIIRHNSIHTEEMEKLLAETRDKEFGNLIFLDSYHQNAGLNDRQFFSAVTFYSIIQAHLDRIEGVTLDENYGIGKIIGDSYEDVLQNNVKPIIWLKGEESLRIFIDVLKSAGLIENVETEKIIQEHFSQTDQKPQPIQWRHTNRLINYLFNKLSEAGLIDTMGRPFKLITVHFLDKKGKPFNRDSLKQDYQNMKYSSAPRGSETIDGIIRKLSPLQ